MEIRLLFIKVVNKIFVNMYKYKYFDTAFSNKVPLMAKLIE
jgi:hypothetical protein